MAREDEEWVSKREFEILKEEFAGVKSELEKRNKDIQSLKRGKHVVGSTTNGHTYMVANTLQKSILLYSVPVILDYTLLPMLHFSSAVGWS